VRNCVNELGFSTVRCTINGAVLFERLWPAGLTAINVIVQEPCPVSDGVGLFEGDHNVQQFKEQYGACQLPSECVNLFDKMPTNMQSIKTWAIAQTPLTSYEVWMPYAVLEPQTENFLQVLHLVLRREGCRLGNVYVEHRQCLSQVHPRAWPPGLQKVYAFVGSYTVVLGRTSLTVSRTGAETGARTLRRYRSQSESRCRQRVPRRRQRTDPSFHHYQLLDRA
jgi:hypothetical protein